MRVRHVAIAPSRAALEAGCPALAPEPLSAVAARYSRNDEGLDAILALVDTMDPEKSVDSIFRMVDYGHQSIADMAPVSIFMDGVSIWLVYLLWAQAARAGGQETSTRYVKFDTGGLVAPDLTGMPAALAGEWRQFLDQAIAHYHEATAFWHELARCEPERMRLPGDLVRDAASDTKAARKLERMTRNFVFDRARYWLPLAAKTNVMMVMPARDWVALAQMLLSHTAPEAVELGAHICSQLQLVTPRLIKHARATPDTMAGLRQELADDAELATSGYWREPGEINHPKVEVAVETASTLWGVRPTRQDDNLTAAFAHFAHRYAHVGREARRVFVRYGIEGIAIAELRDLNRHRTGYKYAPMVPIGFYGARDQMDGHAHALDRQIEFGVTAARRQKAFLEHEEPWNPYWGLLGTQIPFEHGTTLDKMAYEIELRTGLGAHYRYAEHMRAVHAKLLGHLPELHGCLRVGTAEPE